jgi:glycosyltransferase involved in cell wall biosynthesis
MTASPADREDPEPRLSIVIAVRNAASAVSTTLTSVLAARGDAAEVVVIDGASSDGTRRVLAEHAADLAYWVSEPDRGIYHAWNKALVHARGEWLWFLGAGDELPALLSMPELVSDLESVPRHVLIAYGIAEFAEIADPKGSSIRLGEPWADVKHVLRETIPFAHGATFHRRALFERHGPFDERYRIAGDYELLLRELVQHDPVFIPRVVVRIAPGGVSSTAPHDGRRVWERHRAQRVHGLTLLPEWASPTVIRVAIRSWLVRRFGEEGADRVRSLYRRVLRRPSVAP